MSPVLHSPRAWFRWIAANAKRLMVLVLGMAILGSGLAMLVLPGPGVLVIVVGLAVLATEFAWAERMLDRTRSQAAASTSSRNSQLALGVSAVGLITGGGVAIAFSEKYRVIGITVVIAGVCAIGVLMPRVQRWLNAP